MVQCTYCVHIVLQNTFTAIKVDYLGFIKVIHVKCMYLYTISVLYQIINLNDNT